MDDNWYEGERNAMIGIFPVTYVEMIPNENVGSLSRKSSGGGTLPRGGSGTDQLTEGKGKAKFNFQVRLIEIFGLIFFFTHCTLISGPNTNGIVFDQR